MVDILAKALALIAIVGVGVGVRRRGWVHASDFRIFSRLVLGVTLPCALATSFNTFDIAPALLGLVALGVVINLVQEGVGYLLARRRGRQAQAFAVIHGGAYNIGAFATPYTSAFMGHQAMIYSSLFDIGNALSAAGLSYGWACSILDPSATGRAARLVKALFSSPVFVTYLVLLIMRLAHISLPDPVIAFTSTVGAANPFLAMLMIGIGLNLRLERRKIAVAVCYLGLRYAFSIMFALLVWFLLPFPAEVRTVVVMLLFAPLASMIVAFSAELGLDVEVSAFMTSVSIVVGIVTMPLLFTLLG